MFPNHMDLKNMRKLNNAELERKSLNEFKSATKTPIVIVLDNIRSLNNIGSIFRTADSFLVQAIYLCGITACPPHKNIQKTALGATNSVDWKYFKTTQEAIEELKKSNYQIYAIEQAQSSTLLNEFSPEKNLNYALIFGNEVKGVEQEIMNMVDACLEIPQKGTKHSLNIAVSVGIVIWEFFVKLSYAKKDIF